MSWSFNVVVCLHNKNNILKPAFLNGKTYKSIVLYDMHRFLFIFSGDGQLLHIKSFIGTSENAVMIQIWTALITILILKALKETAKYGWQLPNLVAFIRLNLFVKIDLQKWLDKPFDDPISKPQIITQGVLF